MKALKTYTIPFVGLKIGAHHFDYVIDNTFFNHFEYDEFNEANIHVDLTFEKKSTLLELQFQVTGTVNINCDVTNEPYDQDISNVLNLVVKFGQEYNDDNIDILILPHGEYEINIQQYIYELIILSVPLKRIHPGVEDGTLNSELLERLEELSPKIKDKKEDQEDIDPRWDTLKKLLTDK